MSLPEFLFVTEEGDGQEKWFNAQRNAIEAIETSDYQQVVVGTYQLVQSGKLTIEKSVKIVSGKRRGNGKR